MFKKVMLAGLMTATLLGGIAPAYAQRGDEGRGPRGGERMGRPAGNAPQAGQRWQQRGNDRPAAAPAQQQPRATPQWRGNAGPAQVPNRQDWRNNRGAVQPIRPGQPQQQAQQPRPDQWRNNAAQIPGAANRPDGRNDRRDGNRDWRENRRDDWRQNDNRRDDNRPNDWRRDNDRRDDARRNDWRGNNGNWAYDGRRYDDRTRWAGQRRWDNGWRQDRRYDWRSYRDRYGDRYRIGRYYAPRGWGYGYRSFSIGIFLNSLLYANDYWIDDPYSYRLPPAYGTLRWIRYYDDALLVDVRDGYVVDVIHDFFW